MAPAKVPTMHPVKSSNIASVGYDAESETLHVQFLNGSSYAYKGVPAHEFAALKAAPSVGAHLHKKIKGIYPHEAL